MPSPQDYELFLKANPRVPRPRNAAEKMALAGAVAEYSRNYAKAPSKFQEGGKALAEGLKTIGSAGLLLSLGAGASAAFGKKTSDNYDQSTTPNQTGLEKVNREEAREDFTENYRNVATQLSEEQTLTDNPPSNIPTAPPDTPKASVGPKSSGARPTIVRNAAEEFLLRRATQEAEEPSVDFPDNMEPNPAGGSSSKFQSIRTLPTGGIGYQFEAKDLLGDKKSKGKPNIQYETEPSQPIGAIPEDVKLYGVSTGESSYREGDRPGQMSKLASAERYLKHLESRVKEVDYEDKEFEMRNLVGGGLIGAKGGPRPSDVVKAVQTGNYSSIFPDDDGPKLDGDDNGGNIPPSPTDTPEAIGSSTTKIFTSRRGDSIVDKSITGVKIDAAAAADPWFDEGQKRMEDAERGDISDKGAERLFNRMDELGAREDKKKAPKSKTQKAEDLLNKMNSRREGDMAQDGPNKPSYDAKQRIAKKTQEKRNRKANPLDALDKISQEPQDDNPIIGGIQGGIKAARVLGSMGKRGVQDTKEVLGNVTDRAKNFVRNQEIDKADKRFKDAGLPNFKQALDREREIKDNLNKGGAGLTPEQKSEAIRKMMIDEGYGDYLS